LGIPRRTLYVYVAQGTLPAVHVGRRRLLILKDTVDQLLASGALSGSPAAALTEF
jgi:excisionase family DNA binding protein